MLTLRVPATLVVAAIPGLWTPWPWVWLLAAGALTVLLTGADLAAAGPVGTLRASRAGDRRARAHTTATVTLQLHNDGTRPVHGQVRDAWVPSAGAHSTPAATDRVTVPPGGSTTVHTALTPTRPGDRPAARVTVRSYGPLRLAYRQTTRRQSRQLTPPWTLRVLPPFTSRRLLPEKLARLRTIDGRLTTRGRGEGTEFDSLREYVVGDDSRSVDWRATARAEHVMVKTWRPEQDRRVLCVLDTGRTSAARVDHAAGGAPRLDAAVDATLLLGSVAAHAGDRVDLLAGDTTVRATASTGRRRSLPTPMVDALAGLTPELGETDYARLTREILARAGQRALVVVFTALDPGTLGDGLLSVVAHLRTRHRLVVASVRDPALDRLAAGRADAAAVYTAAAATRTRAADERVAALLRRHGAHVVEEPPERFAGAVTDTYLTLKATGRL